MPPHAPPAKPALKIEHVSLDRLKPWDKNPRKNDAAAERLAQLIEAHGFINPIVATPDGTIRAGHTRYKAALKLGLIEVPVVFVDFASEAQAHAYALADNKAAEWSEWDIDGVIGILTELQSSSVPLLDTGFSAEEIDQLLNPYVMPGGDPDDVPAIAGEARTCPGDLYQMGSHRLLCGNATVITDVERLMAGETADMVFTDPPYNVDYTGKTKDALKIENDKMSAEDFRTFLCDAFTSMLRFTKPGGAIYITHADIDGYNFRGAMTDAGWLLKQCLVWVKQSLVMGRQDYHWQHEPILYGWAPGAAHAFYGGRTQTTVLHFDRPSRSEEHPTMKPVALIEYLLGNSSLRGSLVLDLFGGSGSTLIACEQTGRRCNIMELDPRYCDVIIDRWQRFTGKKVVRL